MKPMNLIVHCNPVSAKAMWAVAQLMEKVLSPLLQHLHGRCEFTTITVNNSNPLLACINIQIGRQPDKNSKLLVFTVEIKQGSLMLKESGKKRSQRKDAEGCGKWILAHLE